MERLSSDLGERAVRVTVGAVVAGAVWRFLCLFPTTSESGIVLVTAFGGTFGGCLGNLEPGWKAVRLAANAMNGVLLSLIFYCCARGFMLRAIAPASTVQACGVGAIAFLASASGPRDKARKGIHLVARRAAVLLILMFLIQGFIFLWR